MECESNSGSTTGVCDVIAKTHAPLFRAEILEFAIVCDCIVFLSTDVQTLSKRRERTRTTCDWRNLRGSEERVGVLRVRELAPELPELRALLRVRPRPLHLAAVGDLTKRKQ